MNPPHRPRLIGSTFQLLRQFVQPALCSVRFDVVERLFIYPRCSAVGFAAFVGERQYVLPVHLVIQRIEAKVRRFLRFRRVTQPVTSEHFPGLLGSSPIPSSLSLLALISNQGPFPPPALPGFIGTTNLSVTPNGPAWLSRVAS